MVDDIQKVQANGELVDQYINRIAVAASQTKDKYIHGLADDNVHFQNTAEYVEKLVQEGIQFEMQTYTNRNHSIYGGKTRDHLLKRLETFLETNL